MAAERKADILYLNHVARMSGAEASLLSLLAHLDTRSFRPVVGIGAEGPLVEELRRADLEVLVLPHPRLRRTANPRQLVAQYLELRRAARGIAACVGRREIDLVHANSLSSAICAGRALGKDVPFIWHARDLRLPAGPTRWVARRARAIIAISHAVAKTLGGIAPRAPAKTTVIHNGIDADAFRPRPSRERLLAALELPADALLVGGVGQLVPWKEWPRFLRVSADVAARVPQARFLILGDDLFHDRPGYRQELEALARKLAIGRVTHFLGYRRDVPDVVSAFDVFLHCPEDEPLGRALMEAMALERPVVAVASAGPAEIVLDGESGLLAPPRNTYAIAERVIRLLRDRDLAARLGRAARERIRTAFRPEQAARMTEEVYRAVLWESGGLGSAAREGS